MIFLRRFATLLWVGMAVLSLSACGGTSEERESALPATPEQDKLADSIAESDIPYQDEVIVPGQREPVRQGEARKVKVAMLLPLSGPAENLGRSMLDAAMLALHDKHAALTDAQKRSASVVLMPKDTRGTVSDAIQMSQEAMREQANLILGPVFGKSLRAMAPMIRGQGVNIIAFTNDKTTAGEGVFVMGFLPEQQIDRIVEVATQNGMRHLAALLPQDAYGSMIATAFEQAALKRGAEITHIKYYPSNATGFNAEIQELFSLQQTDRKAKLEAGYDEMAALKDTPQQTGPAFDALLIPEGGKRLLQIVRTMQEQGVDMRSFKLLGSGQWDDEQLFNVSALNGSWFASAIPEKRLLFERHFERFYGYKPERLASLAYDATALAATLAYTDGGRELDLRTLTDPRGFTGPVDGIFRFLPSGVTERGLAVMELTPQGLATISPAPVYFE